MNVQVVQLWSGKKGGERIRTEQEEQDEDVSDFSHAVTYSY